MKQVGVLCLLFLLWGCQETQKPLNIEHQHIADLEAPVEQSVKGLDAMVNDVLHYNPFAPQLDKEKQERIKEVALKAILAELGDQYSDYIPPNHKDQFTKARTKIGVGVVIGIKDEQFVVQGLIENAPAEKAGMQVEDRIVAFDGKLVPKAEKVTDITRLLSGEKNTLVELTVERGEDTIDISFQRAEFEIPMLSLRWRDEIPVVTIRHFDRDIGARFQEFYNEHFLGKNFPGMVFDLRGNQGGHFQAAVQILEWFADEGETLLFTSKPNRTSETKSARAGLLRDQSNIFVLQNKVTASAAEIFTGFFRTTGRGTVMGAPSRGKGTIQRVVNYADGSALKLTTARWLTPNEKSIHEIGVVPHIQTSHRTELQRNQGQDPVLEQAIELIKKR